MGLFGIKILGSDSASALIDSCYSLGEVPGRTITQTLGLIEFTKKGVAGNAPDLSESIFQSLLAAAKKRGANAVVNVRLVSGSYEQKGSKWQVSYVIAYGDAVVLS